MTTLFTRNLMKGIADGMSDSGAMLPFSSDDLATGVFDKIAEDLNLPPILETHLPNEVYVKIGQQILQSSKIAQDSGYGIDASTYAMSKQASAVNLSDRALAISAFYMDKAAEEASLNGTGVNTPESAAATNAIARLDQANRSSLQYLVGMGNTDMPEGGILGRQMMHPMSPRGPAIHNSLTNLDKMAASEDMSEVDMQMSPEERELLEASLKADRSEKVARAITFMEGLANRGAPIEGKTVLAAAILADSSTTGLEVMSSLIQHTKTAAELDGHLDDVMASGAGHHGSADPHLVKAIENALAEHAGEEVDEDEEPGDVEEHAEKAAGIMRDIYEKGKSKARSAVDYVKGKARAGAEAAKGKAREGAEYAKGKAREGKEYAKGKEKEYGAKIHEKTRKYVPEASASEQARSAARKAKEEVKEKIEGVRDKIRGGFESDKARAGEAFDSAKARVRSGYESDKSRAGEAFDSAKKRVSEGAASAKEKAESAYGKAKEKAEGAYDKTRQFMSDHKKELGIGAGGVALGVGGLTAARALRDDDEKDAELLDFLKAAADGSLNEVDENTPEDAAHYNANAELDMENRSPDEYLEGAGESEMPNVGHRGASMAAPKGPSRVNPDNTATRETKSASFDYKVKAAAQFWGPKLPATMSQNEKRAHVIALAGMPSDLQAGYVGSLYSR